MFIAEMFRAGLLSTRNGVVRLRRRFNLSFWCAVYNIFLAIMLFISFAVSALGFVSRSLFGAAKTRVRNFFIPEGDDGATVLPFVDKDSASHDSQSTAA